MVGNMEDWYRSKEYQIVMEIDCERQEEGVKKNLGFATFGKWWDNSIQVTELPSGSMISFLK